METIYFSSDTKTTKDIKLMQFSCLADGSIISKGSCINKINFEENFEIDEDFKITDESCLRRDANISQGSFIRIPQCYIKNLPINNIINITNIVKLTQNPELFYQIMKDYSINNHKKIELTEFILYLINQCNSAVKYLENMEQHQKDIINNSNKANIDSLFDINCENLNNENNIDEFFSSELERVKDSIDNIDKKSIELNSAIDDIDIEFIKIYENRNCENNEIDEIKRFHSYLYDESLLKNKKIELENLIEQIKKILLKHKKINYSLKEKNKIKKEIKMSESKSENISKIERELHERYERKERQLHNEHKERELNLSRREKECYEKLKQKEESVVESIIAEFHEREQCLREREEKCDKCERERDCHQDCHKQSDCESCHKQNDCECLKNEIKELDSSLSTLAYTCELLTEENENLIAMAKRSNPQLAIKECLCAKHELHEKTEKLEEITEKLENVVKQNHELVHCVRKYEDFCCLIKKCDIMHKIHCLLKGEDKVNQHYLKFTKGKISSKQFEEEASEILEKKEDILNEIAEVLNEIELKNNEN